MADKTHQQTQCDGNGLFGIPNSPCEGSSHRGVPATGAAAHIARAPALTVPDSVEMLKAEL